MMASKEELLARITELQAVRDSMRTKVELEKEVAGLERQVAALEEEIAWREQCILSNPSLKEMDEIIRDAGIQFEQECRARKKKLEEAVAGMATEIEYLDGQLQGEE